MERLKATTDFALSGSWYLKPAALSEVADNHGFAIIQADPIVATKPTRLPEPVQRMLHDPGFHNDSEAFRSVRTTCDFQPQLVQRRRCLAPAGRCRQVPDAVPKDMPTEAGNAHRGHRRNSCPYGPSRSVVPRGPGGGNPSLRFNIGATSLPPGPASAQPARTLRAKPHRLNAQPFRKGPRPAKLRLV